MSLFLFVVLYYNKLNLLGFWTVDQTKKRLKDVISGFSEQ